MSEGINFQDANFKTQKRSLTSYIDLFLKIVFWDVVNETCSGDQSMHLRTQVSLGMWFPKCSATGRFVCHFWVGCRLIDRD